MTTDFRALCAELLSQALELIDTGPRDDATIIRHQELFDRARTALAQPEPVGPTDDQAEDLADALNFMDGYAEHEDGFYVCASNLGPFARAVLARWGHPTITPIPVSERLPGAEDCDAEGRCWVFTPERHSDPRTAHSWHLTPAENIKVIARVATEEGDLSLIESVCPFWLPFHALPLPATPENADG
jgi:hypothetical protein